MSKKKSTALGQVDLEQVSGGSQVNGSRGDDRINTGETNLSWGGIQINNTADLVSADSGNDYVYTGFGEDTIFGGNGNDTIDSGMADRDDDRVHGGMGDDVFLWSPHSGRDFFEGGPGRDTVKVIMPAYERFDLDHFINGLSVDGSMMLVRHVDGNTVSFTDRSGNPVAISGSLQTEYGLLTFTGVERFEFSPAQDMPRY